MDVVSRAEGTQVTPYWPNHTHTHTLLHTHTHKPPTSLKHPPHPSQLASRHLEPEGLPVSPPLPETRPSSWGRKGAGGTWVKGAGAMVLHSHEPQTKLNRCVPPLTSVRTHGAWGVRGLPQCRLPTWPRGQVEIIVSRWILLSLFLLRN